MHARFSMSLSVIALLKWVALTLRIPCIGLANTHLTEAFAELTVVPHISGPTPFTILCGWHLTLQHRPPNGARSYLRSMLMS